jgi:hypothetical protein
MFTTFPTRRLVTKALAGTVVCGALAFGAAGVASPAVTTTTAPAPVSTHVTCARAPRALAKIAKREAAGTKRLSKLQAAETKLTAKGHPKLAAKVEKRIARLHKAETRGGTLTKKIEAKCPGATAASTT